MELAQRQSEDISRLKEELLTSRQTNEEIDSELAQLRYYCIGNLFCFVTYAPFFLICFSSYTSAHSAA